MTTIAQAEAESRLLRLSVDPQPEETSILSLARNHPLSVYDAAYLELAMRRRLPLATEDRALITAAPHVGVERWTP